MTWVCVGDSTPVSAWFFFHTSVVCLEFCPLGGLLGYGAFSDAVGCWIHAKESDLPLYCVRKTMKANYLSVLSIRWVCDWYKCDTSHKSVFIKILSCSFDGDSVLGRRLLFLNGDERKPCFLHGVDKVRYKIEIKFTAKKGKHGLSDCI